MNDTVSLEILKYCAEEVSRQGDDAQAVYWMVQAWQQARTEWKGGAPTPVSKRQIEQWGILVQPARNGHCDGRGPGGFRDGAVFVGLRRCPEYYMLSRLLDNLVEAINEGRLDAERAYYEFEMIHPFFDGNGRTGKILFNYISGTLDHPALPPNFFGCSNF